MRLIGLAVILAVGLALAPFAVEAQRGEKVYRIGFLGPGSTERVYTDPLQSLRASLRELGYAEGKNIVFEYRFAEDKYERLPGLAAELVRDKVDVIVVHASPGTRAAKQATSTIPIVMISTGDPVGTQWCPIGPYSPRRSENLKFAASTCAVYGKSTGGVPSTVGGCTMKGSRAG